MTTTTLILLDVDGGWRGRLRVTVDALERYGAPILDVAVRLWIARVFLLSGLTKIKDWESTLFLFEYEYAVPVLPFELTAFLATAFELGAPVLLVFGLMTRLAALPLLAMTLVIQFALGAANPAYDNMQHFYWMFLLAALILRGAGPLSVDRLLAGRF